MKTIIIGDVHGCYREMMELLSKIGPTTSDQVYFVGDLINKGPSSKQVVQTVRQNGYLSILGNHEWSYLRRYYGNKHQNSIPSFFQSKKHPILNNLLHELTEEESRWLADLPFYRDLPECLLIHGGILPNRSLPHHHPHEILNVRNINNQPWYDYYRGQKLIVYGHWAIQGLMVKDNSIGLDSGCVYGQKLSGVILPERKIVQVKSKTSVL